MARELDYAFFEAIGVCGYGRERLRAYDKSIVNSVEGWLEYVRFSSEGCAPFFTMLLIGALSDGVYEDACRALGVADTPAYESRRRYETHGADERYVAALKIAVDEIERQLAASEDKRG